MSNFNLEDWNHESDFNLEDWCNEKGFPIKVAALLSVWTPDEEELNDWNVTMIDDNTVSINDTKYIIYNDDEAFKIITNAEKELQEQMESELELPSYLQGYIDWDRFWLNNDLQLNEATGITFEEITFQLDSYYYAECD